MRHWIADDPVELIDGAEPGQAEVIDQSLKGRLLR